MSFEFLKHTADMKMIVRAGNLKSLFKEALKGMAFAQKSKILPEEKLIKKRLVEIQSTDRTALLVDFLNEVLAQSQINKEIYLDVKFTEFSDVKIKAEIYGICVDKFDEDIKAATYHEADIKQNKRGAWKTIIIFDV